MTQPSHWPSQCLSPEWLAYQEGCQDGPPLGHLKIHLLVRILGELEEDTFIHSKYNVRRQEEARTRITFTEEREQGSKGWVCFYERQKVIDRSIRDLLDEKEKISS